MKRRSLFSMLAGLFFAPFVRKVDGIEVPSEYLNAIVFNQALGMSTGYVEDNEPVEFFTWMDENELNCSLHEVEYLYKEQLSPKWYNPHPKPLKKSISYDGCELKLFSVVTDGGILALTGHEKIWMGVNNAFSNSAIYVVENFIDFLIRHQSIIVPSVDGYRKVIVPQSLYLDESVLNERFPETKPKIVVAPKIKQSNRPEPDEFLMGQLAMQQNVINHE